MDFGRDRAAPSLTIAHVREKQQIPSTVHDVLSVFVVIVPSSVSFTGLSASFIETKVSYRLIIKKPAHSRVSRCSAYVPIVTFW